MSKLNLTLLKTKPTNMKEHADNQMKEFTLSQAKNCIKSLNSGEYDKMIFNKGNALERTNFLFVKYDAKSATRSLNRIEFPMHSPLVSPMKELEGGSAAHGEKSIMKSDNFINSLASRFSRAPELDKTPAGFYFDFPLDTIANDTVSPSQRLYYIPEETEVKTCGECSGEKHITCDDYTCEGRHEWTCTPCDGDKKVTCRDCDGDGQNTCGKCHGNGMVKCGSTLGSGLVGLSGSSIAGCGGKGYVMVSDGKFANGDSRPKKRKKCTKCRGKGEVKCSDCVGKGEIKCSPCSGIGEVKCQDCSGKGTITCSKCYGDKEKYGRIDCPTCEATGETGALVYIQSTISNYNKDKFINLGKILPDLDDEKVLLHVNKGGESTRMFTNINENIQSNHDEMVVSHAENFRSDLGLSSDSFEKVLTENLYYEVVPCVQITYTHILTNTEHTLSIINVFNKPELVFHSQAEEVKRDLKNTGKAVGGMFGKLFKTKKHKGKEDKKNEIKLMIYLSKADGVIEDEEKSFLANKISSLDDFTAGEKQVLFDLMNMRELPALTANDVLFSTPEKGKEVADDLIKLASADGELDPREQKLIDEINSMMKS